MNNVKGVWAQDQATAAAWALLRPHTWGWIVAGVAVALTVALAVRGLRLPVRAAPDPGPDLDARAHRRWLWALVALLLLFYAPGLNGTFSIYDDPQNIHNNPVVTQLTWPHTREILFENHNGVNQEWMYLSLQLCWAAFGNDYSWFYAVNLFFFGLILLLVDRVAWRLLEHRAMALLATAFVGLSPIYAELTSWMLARGHLFGLLFALASCAAYLEYLRVRFDRGPKRWGWLLAALAAFFACQMGKPIYLYVPVWLVLFDAWHRRRDWGRLVVEKAAFGLVALFFLRRIVLAGQAHGRVKREYIGGSISNTLALDANQLLEYFRSAFLPHSNGVQIPWNEPASWWYVEGVPNILILGFPPVASLVVLICAVVSAILLAWRWRWPVLLLALLGGAVTIAPVANLPVHTVVTAYRYTLSMNVLVALVQASIVFHLLRWPRGWLSRHRWAPIALGAAWLTLGAWHTNANRAAWRTPVELWTRSADVLYPNDGWSHYYAGKALQRVGRYHESAAHLELSERFMPGNVMVYRRLGDVYYELGDVRRAEETYRTYFSKQPGKVTDAYRKRLIELGADDLVAPGARKDKRAVDEEDDGSDE